MNVQSDYLSVTSSTATTSSGIGLGVSSSSSKSTTKGNNNDGRQSSQGIQSDCSTFEYLPNDLACSSSSAYSPASPFLLEDLDSDQHTAPSGNSGSEEEEDVLSSSSSRVISAVAAVHDEAGGAEGVVLSQEGKTTKTLSKEEDELGGLEPVVTEKGGEDKNKEEQGDGERQGELSVQMTILQSLAAVGTAKDGCEQTTSSTVMKIPPTLMKTEEQQKGGRDLVRTGGVEEGGDEVVLLNEKIFMAETKKSSVVSGQQKKTEQQLEEETLRERRGEVCNGETIPLSKFSSLTEDEMWKGVGVHDDEETIRKLKEHCTYTRHVMLQHYMAGLKVDDGKERGNSCLSSHSDVHHAVDSANVFKAAPLNEDGEEKTEKREDPLDYLALLRGLRAVEGRITVTQGSSKQPQRSGGLHHHQSFDSAGDDDGSPSASTGIGIGISPPPSGGASATVIRRYSSRYSLSSNQSHHTNTSTGISGGNQTSRGGEGGGSTRAGGGGAAGGASGLALHRGSSTTTAISSQNSLDSDEGVVVLQRAGGGSSSSSGGSSGSPLTMAVGAHANAGAKRSCHQQEEQVPPEDLVLSEELLLSLNLQQQQRSQGGRRDEEGPRGKTSSHGSHPLSQLGVRRSLMEGGDGRMSSRGVGETTIDQEAEEGEKAIDALAKRRTSGGSSIILSHREEGAGASSSSRRERDVDDQDWRDFRRVPKSDLLGGGGGEQEGEKNTGRDDLDISHQKHEGTPSSASHRNISSHKILNGDAHHVLQRYECVCYYRHEGLPSSSFIL